jgi:hypothetical protein
MAGECKRRTYDIFCMLGRIIFSNNKMVPACQNQQYQMIGECKKEEYDIFCMLGCIIFLSHCRMDAFLYNTASKGTSSLNSKERVMMHLDILLVDGRP